jgi:hypothetical protein
VARELARKCERHVEDRQGFTFLSAVVAESALTLLLLRLRQVISAQPSSYLCRPIHSSGCPK